MSSALARWLDPPVGPHLMRTHDEVIVDEVRRHWFVFVRPAVQAWVGLVVMVWGGFGVQLDLVVLVGLALVLWGAWIAARERREVFVVTNLRVFRLSGVLNTRRASMPLTRILDVTDPTEPTQVAYFRPTGGNVWASYWYGDYVIVADNARGIDILKYEGPKPGRGNGKNKGVVAPKMNAAQQQFAAQIARTQAADPVLGFACPLPIYE